MHLGQAQRSVHPERRVLPERQASRRARVHPEQAWRSAQGRLEPDHPEAVRCEPAVPPEAWFEQAVCLPRVARRAACLQAGAYPRQG